VYGRGAISWLNEDLNINFGGPVASSTTTVRGFQVGGGAEFAPAAWKTRTHPLSIFVEYQHSSWQDASLFSPAASPRFNYNFPREDETFKAGVNVHLGP